MCYIIMTTVNLIWFKMSLITDMLIAVALVTPKWLVGPNPEHLLSTSYKHLQAATAEVNERHNESSVTMIVSPPVAMITRYPSVGIYTRCKIMDRVGYHCGPFDLDGFFTVSSVYPPEWKAAMFFISMGLTIMSITVVLTLVTCCRQAAFGKSIHNMTGCAQVLAGICVMMALFLHPLGWGEQRVQALCGFDSEPFYPGSCNIGSSLYCAIAGAVLAFVCAFISLKAESSNMRPRVRSRVEEGDRLVCIP